MKLNNKIDKIGEIEIEKWTKWDKIGRNRRNWKNKMKCHMPFKQKTLKFCQESEKSRRFYVHVKLITNSLIAVSSVTTDTDTS